MNIPLMLDLGKNIAEYLANTADHPALCEKVNAAFPAEDLQGHKPFCHPSAQTKLGYHGSFLRAKLIDTNGQCHQLHIHLVHCPHSIANKLGQFILVGWFPINIMLLT